ncbi:MAG: TIGR03862 family flavoprotein [Paracoccaceae bacterium]
MAFAVVIGAGPAGLMAAEVLAEAGHEVLVADQKPSFGRKFLMAGKSGLNLTKQEPADIFEKAYEESASRLRPCLAEFGIEDIKNWAIGLEQTLFTGSTGRVFPTVMKASPLLRAWLARLDAFGVERRVRWTWTGWDGPDIVFETPDGRKRLSPDVTILALGGASWAKLGSDGQWTGVVGAAGVELTPFRPANVGLHVDWSSHMASHFGTPLKNIALKTGSRVSRGEAVLSQNGLEGGGVYALSKDLRDGAKLLIDLLPDTDQEALVARLSRPRGKMSQANFLRKTAKLDPVKIALLQEFARPLPSDPDKLAALIKALPVPYRGTRDMDEAISTAGGISWEAVDQGLMLKNRPGVFVAGEMLDWEAPTGGYLLSACFATGRWAGRHACAWLSSATLPETQDASSSARNRH